MTSRGTATPTRSPGRVLAPRTPSAALDASTSGPSTALPSAAFASDPDLRARLQAGRAALVAAERLLVSSKADRRRTHDAELAQLHDEGKRLDRERARLEGLARALAAQLERERAEVEGAGKVVRGLQARQAGLQGQLAALEADEVEVREGVEARRKASTAQRDQLRHQAAQNAPELAFLSDRLGLSIKSRAVDRIVFTFIRIDPSAPKRQFSFEIDVSREAYAVPSCSPALAAMPSLLAELNVSRDFAGFLIAVRAGFGASLGGR